MPFRDLVVLEVVAVVGQLALLPGPLQGPLAVAVLGEDRGVRVRDRSFLDVLGPLGVHAGGAVLRAPAVRCLEVPGVRGRGGGRGRTKGRAGKAMGGRGMSGYFVPEADRCLKPRKHITASQQR